MYENQVGFIPDMQYVATGHIKISNWESFDNHLDTEIDKWISYIYITHKYVCKCILYFVIYNYKCIK